MFTIDFKGVKRLVTPGVTGGFKQTQRTIGETAEKCTGIIDAHRFNLAGQIMFSLFDECFRHRRDIRYGTIDPECGINTVCQQVASDSGTGGIDVQTPETCPGASAYRPVLQKIRTVMKNPAQASLINQLFARDTAGTRR